MKQVLLSLAIMLCYCSCNQTGKQAGCAAEETKTQLLKLAGFDKMNKTFSYDYTIENDSAVGLLNLVSAAGIINFTGDELSKGKLLNVFSVGGRQYNTTLLNLDSSFVMRVKSIDGVESEDIVFQKPAIPPGTPPFLCEDDCSQACIKNCTDYFNRSIYPGLQTQANETCRSIRYCMLCPLGPTPCIAITYLIRPQSIFCRDRVANPEEIATRKMAGGMVIKNPASQKNP